jgi:hypothetical protein
MANHRPTPQRIAALKIEIAKRYKHQSKVGKRTRSMAAIRISELTRWLDHVVGTGTGTGTGAELEPSEWSAGIARIFVHHLVTLSDGNRKAADWMATYSPWIERRDREQMISEANHCPIKWSADKLAWKIRLTDAKRTELKITTIGAIDCNQDQRKARRKRENAERQKRLRAAKRLARVHHIG